MRENAVRTLWSSGRPAINGWLAIPASLTAELMALQGFDSVCIDMQHGAIDYQVALGMLQAISTTAATPLVRVPWNEPGMIGKVLDAGAYGVICPMVNTRAEAEAFVAACRYAPAGHRSVGPLRAALYGGPDYFARANETVLTMAMIETRRAVDNLEEILSTPGLDAVYVGPSDLSVSMGFSPGFDTRVPEVFETIVRIAEAAHRHGVVPGIHVGSVAYGHEMIGVGYRLISYLSDFRLLQWATANGVKALRSGKPTADAP